MSTQVERAHGLEALGVVRSGRVHWNLSPAVLYEIAVRRNEAILAAEGPLVARTGQHTGRSPQDKFTVKEPTTEQNIAQHESIVAAQRARERGVVTGSTCGRPHLMTRRRTQSIRPRYRQSRLAQATNRDRFAGSPAPDP